MIFREKRSAFLLFCLLPLLLWLLVSCGETKPQQANKPVPATPTPTVGPGQQLLTTAAQRLNTAKSLHGLFDLHIDGDRINGGSKSEVWSVAPDKNRTEVHQSSLTNLASGTVFVSDGKQQWQYDPQKRLLYSSPIVENPSGLPGNNFGTTRGQSQLVITLLQTVLTQSEGTLKPTSPKINGQATDSVHVVSQSGAGTSGSGNFTYDGDVILNKETHLPVRMILTIQGVGNVMLDVSTLELNRPIADKTFTFVAPAGVKPQPFPTPAATTGALTLAQAQKQAGYHLLSIPAEQADYLLRSVTALGSPGNQIYTLLYMRGNQNITIAEGRSLANLPGSSGKAVGLRGTTAQISGENERRTLSWTEKGIGLRITGNLSSDQLVEIAQLLT